MASLTIKNIPPDILEGLRERAARNHRSLQGETMALLEEAVKPKHLTISEFYRMVKESGLETPAESADIIRRDRDADRSMADLYREVQASGFRTPADSTEIIRELRDSR